MSDDREKVILNIAEDMVRQGGYNSFSFRNIASAIGIKSSSVHYHFSTKEDLGAAVAKHYTDKFIGALGNAVQITGDGGDPIASYVQAFRNALLEDKGMCLCGILAAETDVLPERVVAETRLFFKRNIEWLESAYQSLGYQDDSNDKAVQAIALLEGAMITSHALGDLKAFDAASKLLANN